VKFSKQYSKLNYNIFTTIRKNKGYYRVKQVIDVETPLEKFKAEIVSVRNITKADITENMAWKDADMERLYLLSLLEDWYGQQCDDFILLTLMRTN